MHVLGLFALFGAVTASPILRSDKWTRNNLDQMDFEL